MLARWLATLRYCLASFLTAFVRCLLPFLLAAHRPMQPLELFQPSLEGLGVGDDRPIREGGERFDPQVHADYWAGVDGYRLHLLHLDAHVPVARLFGDGG